MGLAEQSVLAALGHAALLEREGSDSGDLAERLERASQAVKTVYSECPSYDIVRAPARAPASPASLAFAVGGERARRTCLHPAQTPAHAFIEEAG